MMRWSRTFPGHPEQVARARHFVAAVLARRREAEMAALVTSELCTNALRHSASGGPDGLFMVTVGLGADRARVTVQDLGSQGEPAIAASENGEPGESGRGLLLVAAVAREWGAERNWLGWQVWAELAEVSGDAEPGS